MIQYPGGNRPLTTSSNVMKLTLNLKSPLRSVARVTPYNIKYVIMKGIIAISRQKCQFLAGAAKTKTASVLPKNGEIP